jgi:hypothetical protein
MDENMHREGAFRQKQSNEPSVIFTARPDGRFDLADRRLRRARPA